MVVCAVWRWAATVLALSLLALVHTHAGLSGVGSKLRDADFSQVAVQRGLQFTNYSAYEPLYGRWSDYRVLNRVGKGKFSVVYRGVHRATKRDVALKYLIYPVEYDRVKRELNIMRAMIGAPNVIQLVDVLEEPRNNTKVVVMNFVNQPFPYKKLFGLFNDWDIRHYLYETLVALHHIHSQGIVHRDLKPLNIVFDPLTMSLNVCDLGTADFFIPGTRQKTKLGTKQYKSPELILRKTDYDFKIDVWTVGVTMASMIFKQYPFFTAETDFDQFENLVELLGEDEMFAFLDKYDLVLSRAQQQLLGSGGYAKLIESERHWALFMNDDNMELCSMEAFSLLHQLLQFDPAKRPTAWEAMQHAYFAPIRECWAEMPDVEFPDDLPTPPPFEADEPS